MKGFFSTLYGKISLIFLFLLFLLGSVQILISVQSSLNFVCETDQTLNRDLAYNLAGKFEPFLNDSIDHASVENTFKELMVMNPRIEIYLIDKQGNVLSFFADPDKIKRDQIDTGPIETFLDSEKARFPIMGQDPRDENRERVFSAAEIPIKDTVGYLYVILGSELYDDAMSGVGGSYILSTTALTLGIIFIFTGALGSVLFFNLTKRLRKLTQAVRQFEKGDYQNRIPVTSDDELGQLTYAFNHMADTIKGNMEELRKNDSLRRELIANISHDLRSPITSIQGYLETILMKEDSMESGQRKKFLESILSQVINLNKLVHELFELSKLDSMQTKPNPEPFSLAELVQDVVLKFQQQAEQRNIQLISHVAKNMPFAIGDIGMIDRVLSNLIDNAIRYTHDNGKVKITLSDEGNVVKVRVGDNGEGIPAEDLPHIFDRFYRVEKSRSKHSGGSGLGLAIVKKIVEAHKSSISVNSVLNQGTTFSFYLRTFQPVPAHVTA